MGLLFTLLGLFTKGPLARILDTIDKHGSDAVENEKTKADVVKTYVLAQASVLNGPGWWLPVVFAVPFAIHSGAVCLYSVFFCTSCMSPVRWTIAALPAPFDQWEGIIISSFFIGFAGIHIFANRKT